ncbi:MAG TPA: molybdopterin molybdenumtransferase MoeA, partial [Phenylobacterium sp.]
MIAFDEALRAALDLGRPLGSESVTLDEAFGRVLAAPAKAQQGSPLTDVSAMDGYAVRDADLGAHEVTLRLAGESRAGQTAVDRLEPGSCLRIFTGAPVPEGADRVVIQEEVARQGDAVVFRGLDGGKTHIRKAGSDFQAGDILVDAGSVLDAPRLVALAAADLGEVEVYRRPRVRLIATGDEIREPG